MSERPEPPARSSFPVFHPITLRWMDNDAFGHVNNVAYYSFFDTTVNRHLIERGVIHPTEGEVIGLVVESGCSYFGSVAYPEPIEAGLRVEKVGRSSVRYSLGIFRPEEETALAAGFFTHVYVGRRTRRPTPLPDALRAVVEALR